MMQILTDEQAVEVRDRQVEAVTQALRAVLAAYPGTEPAALTMMVQAVGPNASLLGQADLAAARIAARPEASPSGLDPETKRAWDEQGQIGDIVKRAPESLCEEVLATAEDRVEDDLPPEVLWIRRRTIAGNIHRYVTADGELTTAPALAKAYTTAQKNRAARRKDEQWERYEARAADAGLSPGTDPDRDRGVGPIGPNDTVDENGNVYRGGDRRCP